MHQTVGQGENASSLGANEPDGLGGERGRRGDHAGECGRDLVVAGRGVRQEELEQTDRRAAPGAASHLQPDLEAVTAKCEGTIGEGGGGP